MAYRRLLHFTRLLMYAGLSLFLSFPTVIYAAELKPETVQAWNTYVQAMHARMDGSLSGPSPFLWVDADPARIRRVRAGQILILPGDEHTPRHVPGGLIHHWIGASFMPGVRIEDVLLVVRNYPRYKDFYRPTVVESALVTAPAPAANEDHFSLRFLNKAVLSKTALDAEYAASYVQLDTVRWYGIGYTTRMQEIRNYGEPAERKLPPDQGSGYIWRLYTVTRLVQRDGGVYMEVEVMALSREIPVAVRWVADPIVRRVSRDALSTSLTQTEQAVRALSAPANRTTPALPLLPAASISPVPVHQR